MKNYMNRLLIVLTVFAFALTSKTYAQCTVSGLNTNYCVNSPASTLVPSAPNGTFTGPGMSGYVFNPSVAGPGTHTILYGGNCNLYTISTSSYAPLATTGNPVYLSDDSETGSLPIGFTFTFFCNNYTNFYISSNGFIEFSITGNGCCSGGSMPTNSNPSNMVAYCWTDLNPGVGGSITYTTIGTAPNRTLVVSFVNVPFYSGGGTTSAQIKLFETSNLIEIHTTSTSGNTSSTRTMGIENLGGSVGYPVTGRNANAAWTATNECYRFTPAPVCNVTLTTIVSPSTISVVGSNSICSGSSTTLTASGNSTYSWNVGSNASSIVVSPTVTTTYAVAGTNSYNCVANSAITVTVDNTPTVTAISTSTSNGICPGQTVALTGSGATSYTWNGSVPVTNGVPFSIGTGGNFTVTGQNACGTATAAVSISIHPLPNVTGVASQPSVCTPNPVNIVGVGNAATYTVFGTSIGSLGSGVNFFPTSTANYTVIGTSALGCTNQAVTGVTVVTTPIAQPLSSPPLICIGNTATLSSTGAASYTWSQGSSTLSNASSFTVNPTSSTIYTLSKSNANCVNTQTVQVLVNLLPSVFALAQPSLICASKPTTLTGAGALSYTWTAPNNFTFTGGQPVVSPSVNTTYTLTASDGTCVNTTTVAVATNPNPTVGIVPTSSTICYGQSVSLTANGANSYTWSAVQFTSTPTLTTIAESPTISTLYQVTGQNAFNCTTAVSQVVVVRTTPTLNVQTTKPMVCSGGASGLSVTATGSGPFTYTWDPNAGATQGSVTIVNPVGTTVYSVTGTNSQTCSATGTILVVVFQPTFSVNSPTSSCLGGTVILMASGANTYTWVGGGTFPNYPVSPSGPTVYLVSATSVSLGVSCVSSNSVLVNIYQNPTVTAVASRTQICRGETTNVNAGGASTYVWNTSQTGSTVPVNPINNTIYTVIGTDQNGCLGTATVQVKTSTCVGLDKLAAAAGLSIYPNPNNGRFTISAVTDIELSLCNELGQLIRTIDLNASNSRSVDIQNLAKGIYFLKGRVDGQNLHERIVVSE